MRRILIALALWLAAFPAQAEGPAYVVGVEQLDYFPLYAVREGRYVGAAREILDAFAADAGLRLEYRPLPVKRLYSDLLTGEIDFKFPDSPDWAGEQKRGHRVVYSAPVIEFIDGVMVTPERRGRGLDGFRVLGTVAGFTPFAWLDTIAAGEVTLVENPRFALLLRQVQTGRVDGAYANIAAANHALDAELNMPGALVFDPGLPHARDHYRLSTTRHAEVIAAFDAWLSANPGRVAAIKERLGAEKGVR